MRFLTVDASVVCKWFLTDAPDEPNLREAQLLLDDVAEGRVALIQPVHWRVEVLSVMARRRPGFADEVANALARLNVTVSDGLPVEQVAVRIARECGVHLFDALHHAVALLHPECTLVTADEKYLALASRFRRIVALAQYAGGVGEPELDYHAIVRRAMHGMEIASLRSR